MAAAEFRRTVRFDAITVGESPGVLATRFDVIGANCRSSRRNNGPSPGPVRLARPGVVGSMTRLTAAYRTACYEMLPSLTGE